MIVLAIGCDGCDRNTIPYRIPFGCTLKHVLHDMREEAIALGWERVRRRTWYCPTCRRARDGEELVRRKVPVERPGLAKPDRTG